MNNESLKEEHDSDSQEVRSSDGYNSALPFPPPTDGEVEPGVDTPCVLSDHPAVDLSGQLQGFFTGLSQKMDDLRQETSFNAKLIEKKQEHIDKLYEENRIYKEGLIEQFQTKLVLGVIEQLDRADKQVRTFEEKDESEKNYRNLLDSFRELTEEFREMLQNRFDITPFQSEEGAKFDPKRHKAFGAIPTSQFEKDKTVVQSRRYGYETPDGRILRQEFVEVYYYDLSLAERTLTDFPLSESFKSENENTGDFSGDSDPA